LVLPTEFGMRMKVLLSLFSCEPGKGSEPEVGYRVLLAAAARHDVWALTSATGMPRLEAALRGHPDRNRIHLHPIPAVPPGTDEGDLGILAFQRIYDRWQRAAAAEARRLDAVVDFDLIHHATIATIWTRVGVEAIDKPLVWGPVGGAVEPPIGLLPVLGARGLAEDAMRTVGRRVLARWWQRDRLHSRMVVLAQNSETAHALGSAADPTVVSNGTAVHIPSMPTVRSRRPDVAMVGRLIPWKGAILALRAFREVSHPDAVLRVFGAGGSQERMQRLAARWGIASRLRFEGWIPRAALLEQVAACGVLLHASLHDEAGLCVAEALTLGTPAVCLDHGGPAEVTRQWPETPAILVPPTTPGETARRLAAAVDRFLSNPPEPPLAPRTPRVPFADHILTAYDAAVASG
jgi:glycosyltransferase involved in cell wall biosynthesis